MVALCRAPAKGMRYENASVLEDTLVLKEGGRAEVLWLHLVPEDLSIIANKCRYSLRLKEGHRGQGSVALGAEQDERAHRERCVATGPRPNRQP